MVCWTSTIYSWRDYYCLMIKLNQLNPKSKYSNNLFIWWDLLPKIKNVHCYGEKAIAVYTSRQWKGSGCISVVHDILLRVFHQISAHFFAHVAASCSCACAGMQDTAICVCALHSSLHHYVCWFMASIHTWHAFCVWMCHTGMYVCIWCATAHGLLLHMVWGIVRTQPYPKSGKEVCWKRGIQQAKHSAEEHFSCSKFCPHLVCRY